MIHNHDKLEPAPFLVDNVSLLPRGRALDIAMGNGRNAVYLAQMGFAVEGVDISSEAVSRTREFARHAGVTIGARVVDLESDFHIPTGAYDAIICFYYLQRSLIPQIKSGLRAGGGTVVYETFIVDQAHLGKPQNPAYLLEHNELLDMFRDLRCLRYREGMIGGSAVAGIVAVREDA